MSEREQLDSLLAQWWECPRDMASVTLDRTIAAWKQAMAESGIPEHPGGKCPSQPCPCEAASDQVTVRACELLPLSPAATAEVLSMPLKDPRED